MDRFDFPPLYRQTICFDRLTRLIDAATRVDGTAVADPPHNIKKTDQDAFHGLGHHTRHAGRSAPGEIPQFRRRDHAALSRQSGVSPGTGGSDGVRLTSAPGRRIATYALTPRQQDVLNLIVGGKSNKEIARALKLSEGTVKVHVAALFRNLGVNRRAAAAAAGARLLSGGE